MKVALINTVCGYGSTGRICTNLADELLFYNHEAKIYYGRGDVEEAHVKYASRIGTSTDVHLHVLRARLFDGAGFGSTSATRKLIHDLEKTNPDIIHLHNLHGYYINIIILFEYLKKSNKPVIWTLHDCWSFTGHCAHFDYVDCQKWREECSSCPQKKVYPASYLLDRSNANYQIKKELFNSIEKLIFVTPSKWLEGKVKDSFLSDIPVHVIYNGIDIDKFQPSSSIFREKYRLHNKSIILGVANGWDDYKGLQHFMDIAGKLDNKFQIVLVGLSNRQSRLIPKNVITISRTNNIKELAELYSAADMFVNPTMQEVLGLVNLEALACGTPVITFDTGGSPECIDKSCGIVVQKGNVSELVRAIKYMDKNKPETSDCRKRALLFDKNEKANEYIKLYFERSSSI